MRRQASCYLYPLIITALFSHIVRGNRWSKLSCYNSETSQHVQCSSEQPLCLSYSRRLVCASVDDCRHATERVRCGFDIGADLCCCRGDRCNSPEIDSDNTKQFKVRALDSDTITFTTAPSVITGHSTGALIGISIAAMCVCAIVIAVVVGCILAYLRWARRKSCIISCEDTSTPPAPGDVEKSLSIPKKEDHVTINALHIDRTDVSVPAELSFSERQAIVASLRRKVQLDSVDAPDSEVEIEKVYTYATGDEITLPEHSDRETELTLPTSDSEVEGLLMRLIANGPRQYIFTYDELARVLAEATAVVAREPSLLEVPVPCTIYGDIHGQYSDLHRWFNLNGWPHQNRSVFLGDFVDRGTHGIEVVALICCFKVLYSEKIFVIRGNHEEESLNRAYSFYDEVNFRYPKNKHGPVPMYTHFKNFFTELPLAALVGGRILGMHGGLSPRMSSLQAIRNIERPIDDFVVGSLECDLVWSDPDTGPEKGFRPNLDREPLHGIGQLFGSDTVRATCKALNVDMIIRGHQAPTQGYALFAGKQLMTLFSAPGYKGTHAHDVNMGACIDVSPDMKLTIKQIKVTERFRRHRVTDAEKAKVARKKAKRKLGGIAAPLRE